MCEKEMGKSNPSTWLIIQVFAMPSLPDVSFLLNDFEFFEISQYVCILRVVELNFRVDWELNSFATA